jgi:hypothetical protein
MLESHGIPVTYIPNLIVQGAVAACAGLEEPANADATSKREATMIAAKR